MYMTDIVAEATGSRFREPRIDPADRAADLDRLVELVNERRRGMKRLGAFSIAPVRHDGDLGYFTQIRAIPSSGFGGCEFRFDLPQHKADEPDPSSTADEILASASRFTRLKGIASYVRLSRVVIGELVASASSALHPVRIVAVGMCVESSGATKLCVEVECLGHDLTVGIDRVVGHDVDHLVEKLGQLAARHLRRSEALTLARASRAIGWIEESAIRIADAAGLSRAEAMAMLSKTDLLEFDFGGEGSNLTATLFWEDGVIRGDVTDHCGSWSLEGGRLRLLDCGLPEVVLAAWPRRRFGDVASHPFVPAAAVVTAVDRGKGGWIHVDLVIGRLPIDEASGSPREDGRIA